MGKVPLDEKRKDYMRDLMVKLMSLNSKNFSITEILAKIRNTEQLKK
jgi:hypothetical protein